jgi:hypothetical protein
MRRLRRIKILATLGPASSDSAMVRRLFEAGADHRQTSRMPRAGKKPAILARGENVGKRGWSDVVISRANRFAVISRDRS